MSKTQRGLIPPAAAPLQISYEVVAVFLKKISETATLSKPYTKWLQFPYSLNVMQKCLTIKESIRTRENDSIFFYYTVLKFKM